MTQVFQMFTKRYVNILRVLTGLAVVSSILLYPGCGMTSSRTNTPTNPDRSAPTSAITFPTSGATVVARATTTITGTASDTGGGSVARVEVSVDGGTTFSAATGTTSWSFNWTPTTPGSATIRSRAVDTSGNVQDPPAQITVNVVVGGMWTAMGPNPIRNGQVENITNREVIGAIHTVAPHPNDSNILYVGGVNSGIWRTGNARAASPHWTPLIDNFPSLSIGALEFDPTDATNRTLVAGIGRFSSFGRLGGPLTGILRTTDGGDNWTQISNPTLANQNISGVAARGATLLVSSTAGGVFRSADGGINWTMISGGSGSGLPTGGAFDLVGDPDPSKLNFFYVSIRGVGIFRSTDGGATWANISSGDTTLNGVITQTNTNTGNIEMAVARNGGRLYVVVVVSGKAQYIGFTDNPVAGAAWTAMDLPQTPESNGDIEGLHPGGQGGVHLSIAVDRNFPNIVYVGGDRQDDNGRPAPNNFPNFIGALTFSGRLFRGDTRVASTGAVPSPQWQHLTHSNSIAQILGGGTAHNSSPHADSREMAIDAGGDIIEVDDGGVYRRTSPQSNAGDWFSLIGDIQTTEFHDVAYDTNSNTIILGGTQDNGTPVQISMGSTIWTLISGGDGGDVAVDNITLASSNQSIRYFSSQNLDGFRRQVYDANNIQVGQSVSLATIPDPQFVTPVELNVIDPKRLVIGGSSAVYESFDQGSTVTQINGLSASTNTLAYGGRSGGVDNPDVLYVGSGASVFLRTTAGAPLAQTAALPTGVGSVGSIALDPDDWKSAYVIDNNQVFRTTNAGVSWTDITGNLSTFGAGTFFSTAFIAGVANDMLLVGTNAGVYASFSSTGFTTWNKLGVGLPNAPVAEMDYDVADDVLVAATLGRGAWTITNLRGLTQLTADLQAPKLRDSESLMTQQTTPAHAPPAGHKR
jgi:Big-like domain-containing protein